MSSSPRRPNNRNSSRKPSEGSRSKSGSRSGSGSRPGGRGGYAGRNSDSSRRDERPRRRSTSPKKAKGPGGKIPPPPVIRDTVSVERLEDDAGPSSKRPKGKRQRSRRRDRSSVDVSGVKMGDLAPATASKLTNRLEEAAIAFEKERFSEAGNLLESIQKLAPDVPEVHELQGLVHYRMGRWAKAIKEFEHFERLTSGVEQHPVWADCCRALRRWDEVEDLWYALGQASPNPELVEEGRIVYAGSLADQGEVSEAIKVLEKGPKPKGKPKVHHLRRWYVLADLYERSGDLPRARRLFARISDQEPGFGDVAERQASLR